MFIGKIDGEKEKPEVRGNGCVEGKAVKWEEFFLEKCVLADDRWWDCFCSITQSFSQCSLKVSPGIRRMTFPIFLLNDSEVIQFIRESFWRLHFSLRWNERHEGSFMKPTMLSYLWVKINVLPSWSIQYNNTCIYEKVFKSLTFKYQRNLNSISKEKYSIHTAFGSTWAVKMCI